MPITSVHSFDVNETVSLVEYLCMPNFKVPKIWPNLVFCYKQTRRQDKNYMPANAFQGHKK